MIQKIQGPLPPTPPPEPQGSQPQGSTPAGLGGLEPWSQMFGGMASAADLQKIVALVLQQAINEIKKEQQKAIEAIRKLRKDQEDNQ